jgi:predicted aminopeptidase
MAKYRIEHLYPCYPGGGCIPYDGYFVKCSKRDSLQTDGWT